MDMRPNEDPVAREWRKSAAHWRQWEPYLEAGMWPVTHRMISALRLQPGCRVLDVGSGLGDPALAIALAVGHSGSVVGVDPAPGMIETCRERAAVLGLPNAHFELGSLDDLDEPPDSFHAATARFSIMFAPHPPGLLSRVRRLLRPGGLLVISNWFLLEHAVTGQSPVDWSQALGPAWAEDIKTYARRLAADERYDVSFVRSPAVALAYRRPDA